MNNSEPVAPPPKIHHDHDAKGCAACVEREKIIKFLQTEIKKYEQLAADAVQHISLQQQMITSRREEIERLHNLHKVLGECGNGNGGM